MDGLYQIGIEVLNWLLAAAIAFVILAASAWPGWPKWRNVPRTCRQIQWFLHEQRRAIKRAKKRWPQTRLALLLATAEQKKLVAKNVGVLLAVEAVACVGMPLIMTYAGGIKEIPFFEKYLLGPMLFTVFNLLIILRFMAGDDDDDRSKPPRPTDPGPIGQLIKRPLVLLRIQGVSKVKNGQVNANN